MKHQAVSGRDLLMHAKNVLDNDLAELMPYFENPAVQEIMINKPDQIFIEMEGRFTLTDIKLSSDKLTSAMTTLGNINVKSASGSLIDCRLPGLRIAATRPPVAVFGPAMCIRRHSSRAFELNDYLGSGAFSKATAAPSVRGVSMPAKKEIARGGQALMEFLIAIVEDGENFIVSGSTSSGKTAFLNAMARHIPPETRVITIEDTAELTMPVKNWLAFEANKSAEVDIRALVKHALRNRPNRIWVGEGRGAEFYDILDAYNTGHRGSSVTFHSDSAAMALPRLENMIRMASESSNWPLADLRRQIAATFRYVIHCANANGLRGPVEVIEILGADQGSYQTESLFSRIEPSHHFLH